MQNPTDSGFHSTEESGHMLSTTNHLCTYMDGTKCRFTQKGGASPKAQPQSEGYTSLALLKPLCSSKNFSDIKEDRGAHSNYIAYF